MILYYSGVPTGFLVNENTKEYHLPEDDLTDVPLMLSYAIQRIRKDERKRFKRIVKQRT